MSRIALMGDALGRPGMFYRSVALERDASDPSAGRSYVTTPWLERGAREILSGMTPGGTRRAWRIIGDFGVGKSALALALVQALDPRVSDPGMPMRRIADAVEGAPRMFPLLVTGSRKGLRRGLSAAIAQAAGSAGLLGTHQAERVLAIEEPIDAVIALRDAIRETAKFDGLLLIVDEMGKFLEAAGEGAEADVYRLQALAETAARSGDSPLGVILILHKGFQSYGEDWRAARRSEWEKVAERFEEMIFDHPLSHTAALLAAALGVDDGALPAKVHRSHEDAVARVRALGWLGPRNGTGSSGCWPVHPAAVPVLARFFAAFGQNERSLFGFAASEEPNSLRSFASGTPIGRDLYGIHHFFDYVSSSFGHRLTSRTGAGEWDRIGAVLERAADADEAETAVLKTIGILNLIDAPDLAATAGSVAEALAPQFAKPVVEDAVARLLKGGMLFRRPGRAELRLWTSRRVDLSVIWAEAEREVEASSVITDLPRYLVSLPIRAHLLARRHSVISGTNRRFAVRCTHASALAGYSGHGDADGGIVAVVCGDAEDMRIARAWCAEITNGHPTRLAAVVPPMQALGTAMVDLLRHRWVVANAAALQEDAFAAAEIERTIADLEGALTAEMETVLGLRGHAPPQPIDVYWKGEPRPLAEPMHAAVSNLCDRVYDAAPRVENELVNRHALTTAGAGARQRLIDAMFAHALDPELGFKAGKNPPERALYLSLLRRGRVHRQVDGVWSLAPPAEGDDPLRLKPALDAMASRLAGAAGRVPLNDVYREVEGKPYGVRRGLSPLLLAITLVAAGHRVALFERGTYCTRLDGAAFMRMLKSPEHFALQWVSLEGVRNDVFKRLAQLFDRPDAEHGIRAVVDPLIRFGVGLPFHVQRSATLGPEAKAVRQALAQARSPIDLVFVDLPAACGEEPFGPDRVNDGERAARFVQRLDAAVTELRGCYPLLLETMRTELLRRLEAPDRTSLKERAAAIAFRVREQVLRTFALRMADGVLADDGWIEAIGGAIIGKPPERWLDNDVELWRSRLADLAAQFQRVEAVSFGEVETGRNAVRLSLTRVDGGERSVIVDLAELTQDQLDAIGSIERMAAEANLSLDKIAALLSLESMSRDDAVKPSTAAAEVQSK
jgi:hypothetical protein